MTVKRKIATDIYYVGASDRCSEKFENVYPIPDGMAYNSYLLLDEENILFDAADVSVRDEFLQKVKNTLDGRPLHKMVVNHVEPDHCAVIEDLLRIYPDMEVLGSAKAKEMIQNFFPELSLDGRYRAMKEGDVLQTGTHEITFMMAPMVHWPEVMIEYDKMTGTLFAADAFGAFGALSGNLFDDEMDCERIFLDEARRYYAGIVGKYGMQVQKVLKKAEGLDIKMIAPLHGPILRGEIPVYLDKYQKWSTYTPEEQGVLIVYGSIYGHTKKAAYVLADLLAEKGVQRLTVMSASESDPSYILSEVFRYSHVVLASSTYNAGIFTPMENFLMELKAHAVKNRTFAIMENGSWAPSAGKHMKELLEGMKGNTVLDATVSIRGSLKDAQMAEMENLAGTIYKTL